MLLSRVCSPAPSSQAIWYFTFSIELNSLGFQYTSKNEYGPIRIMAQHWDRIRFENSGIASVPEKADYPRITELIKHAYDIRPIQDESIFERDLFLIRDVIINSINDGSYFQFEHLISQYRDVIEEFLSTLHELKLQFSFDAAQKDTEIISEWTPISSIRDHYIDILKKSILNENSDIIGHSLHFPFSIMRLSVIFQDHLTFQRFSRFYIRIYHEGMNANIDPSLKTSIVERSWKGVDNFYKYEILPRFNNFEVDEDTVKNLRDYSIYLIGILSELMKISLDYENFQHFREIASVVNELGKWHGGRSPVRLIERDNDVHQMSDDDKCQLMVGKQLEKIIETRKQAVFGIGGWLIHLFEQDILEADVFINLIHIVRSEFNSFSEVYKIFFSLMGETKLRRLFNWDWWELKERPDMRGQVTSQPMQFDSWLSKLYTYLSVIFTSPNAQRAPSIEPHIVIERVYVELLKNFEFFEKVDKWQQLIIDSDPEEYRVKKDVILEIHRAALEEQQAFEEKELIKVDLEDEKIRNFSEELEKTWESYGVIRNLVNEFGRYRKHKEEAPKDLDQFGIKSIDPKGVFIDKPKVHYIDWGGGYGRGLARAEDNYLSEEFKALSVEYKDIKLDDIVGILVEATNKQIDNGYLSVVFFSNPQVRASVRQSEFFKPGWMLEDISQFFAIEGKFANSLMVSLDDVPLDEIVLVDLRYFADLVQYPPNGSEHFPIYVDVNRISVEKAHEFYSQHPGFPKDSESGELLEGEDAIRWFMKRVTIDIYERIRFENIDKESGLRIKINLEEE